MTFWNAWFLIDSMFTVTHDYRQQMIPAYENLRSNLVLSTASFSNGLLDPTIYHPLQCQLYCPIIDYAG